MKIYLLMLSLLVTMHATIMPDSEYVLPGRARRSNRRAQRQERRATRKQSRRGTKRPAQTSSGAVRSINSQEEYNQAIASGNVVVKFYKSTCGHCQAFAPVYENAAGEHSNISFLEVSADQGAPSSSLAAQYVERGYPTIIFYKDGQKIDEEVGALEDGEFRNKLSSLYN